MGKVYKLYEQLCYDSMTWAYNKGKEKDKLRRQEETDRRYKEIYDYFEINFSYAENKWNKHLNEILHPESEA